MEIFLNILNDFIIIVGNLVIFSTMLDFKKLSTIKKVLILISGVIMMVAYTLCAYLWKIPYIYASICCFTLPSLLIFWIMSEIKDSRFFLSFCIVDTVSLIIAFVTKYFAIIFPVFAVYITLAINIVVYTLIIVLGNKLLKRYAELLHFQKGGWTFMMIASFVIYFAFYFFAAYPSPIRDRVEYAPSYFVFCGVVLTCYMVFFDSMLKTKKLHTQYKELEQEKIYHKIAYTDALTGLFNRAYYIEKINELERDCRRYSNICCVVIDLNYFKQVNDEMGHQTGDAILQDVANNISYAFKDFSSFEFRTGGDEFTSILFDVDEERVKNQLELLEKIVTQNKKSKDIQLSVASGYHIIDLELPQAITIEQAFDIADKNMYQNKKEYKETHPITNE